MLLHNSVSKYVELQIEDVTVYSHVINMCTLLTYMSDVDVPSHEYGV